MTQRGNTATKRGNTATKGGTPTPKGERTPIIFPAVGKKCLGEVPGGNFLAIVYRQFTWAQIREGAQLNPREIRIDLETNTLVDVEVDGAMRKAFAEGLFMTTAKQPVPDAPASARSSEEAYATYVDIKGQDREGVVSGLRKIVEDRQLQIRGELAQALGCSASALDAMLQEHGLCNTDIGLKSTPGRKRHWQ